MEPAFQLMWSYTHTLDCQSSIFDVGIFLLKTQACWKGSSYLYSPASSIILFANQNLCFGILLKTQAKMGMD